MIKTGRESENESFTKTISGTEGEGLNRELYRLRKFAKPYTTLSLWSKKPPKKRRSYVCFLTTLFYLPTLAPSVHSSHSFRKVNESQSKPLTHPLPSLQKFILLFFSGTHSSLLQCTPPTASAKSKSADVTPASLTSL